MKLSRPLRNFFAATALAGAATMSSAALAQDEAPETAPPLQQYNSITEIMEAAGVPQEDRRKYGVAVMQIINGISHRYVDGQRAQPTSLYEDVIEGMNEALEKDPNVSFEDVFEAGFDKALHNLDPHSDYLGADELDQSSSRLSGNFAGLGIRTTKEDENAPVVVESLIGDDVPAAKAGLQAGDKITHIDGTSVDGLTIQETSKMMKGEKGTDIDLTVDREGENGPLSITVTRDIIETSPVNAKVIDGDVGYIRLAAFTDNADKKMDEAIEQIEQDAGGNVGSYILDLRFNSGGHLDQAAEIVDNFVNSGTLVSIKNSKGEGARFIAEQGDLLNGKPLVILVNGYSASASEVVSGSLQDKGRAKVVGGQTFGKGSAQQVLPLKIFDRKTAVKLTTSLYYTAGGTTPQGRGVTPDISTAFTLAAENKESLLDHTIVNPEQGAANKPARSPQHCDANPASAVPGAGDVHEDYVINLRDGTKEVDFDLMCAVQALKGNNPYVRIQDNTNDNGQSQTPKKAVNGPAFGG